MIPELSWSCQVAQISNLDVAVVCDKRPGHTLCIKESVESTKSSSELVEYRQMVQLRTAVVRMWFDLHPFKRCLDTCTVRLAEGLQLVWSAVSGVSGVLVIF